MQEAPYWADIDICTNAEYLGVFLGIMANSLSWNRPRAKFINVIARIQGAGQGWFYAVLQHNRYAAPVLHYIAQFFAPDSATMNATRSAYARLSNAPFTTVTACIQSNLRMLGLPAQFSHLATYSIAARARLALRSKCYAPAMEELTAARNEGANTDISPALIGPLPWESDAATLHSDAIVSQLFFAVRDTRSAGCDLTEPHKHGFQASLYEKFLQHNMPEARVSAAMQRKVDLLFDDKVRFDLKNFATRLRAICSQTGLPSLAGTVLKLVTKAVATPDMFQQHGNCSSFVIGVASACRTFCNVGYSTALLGGMASSHHMQHMRIPSALT